MPFQVTKNLPDGGIRVYTLASKDIVLRTKGVSRRYYFVPDGPLPADFQVVEKLGQQVSTEMVVVVAREMVRQLGFTPQQAAQEASRLRIDGEGLSARQAADLIEEVRRSIE